MSAPVTHPRETVVALLRDPESGAPLRRAADGWLEEQGGVRRHPVAEGVPWVLPSTSGLRPDEPDRRSPGRRALADRLRALVRIAPSVTRNVGSERNFAELVRLLAERPGVARVLVVGGAEQGVGFGPLRDAPDVELVETDVVVGSRTDLVCDAHALPFADGTFDAVVCQGVLGVLTDPRRAVEEFHRVLAPDGLLYTEVPFLQGVYNGGLDFTRWTMAGHRRLLNRFAEIRSGAHNGPGTALAWQITYFLMAFAGESRIAHALLRRIAALSTFWLTAFDPWLVRRAGGPDGASGTFFLGRRSEQTVSDEAIVVAYRGAIRPSSDPRPA